MGKDPYNFYSEEDKAFFAVLRSEDDIGVILRVHLHCDQILRAILESHAKYPAALSKVSISFPARVHLLSALGLIDASNARKMLWLDNMRNDLAHQAGRQLTMRDYERLLEASGAGSSRAIRQTNSFEKDPTPGNLIRNALFHWRNNLKYLQKKGVEASERVQRWEARESRSDDSND